MDKRKNNGGARKGAGAPTKDDRHKKKTVSFQIIGCHVIKAKAEIKALIAAKYSYPIAASFLASREELYPSGCSSEMREQTKKRLMQLQELGLTEVRAREFGITDYFGGLYIETVWNNTDESWDKYIKRLQTLVEEKSTKAAEN